MPRMKAVGVSFPKEDALRKAVGETDYGDDGNPPGSLFGKVVRACPPPARVKRIDKRPALAVPGVRCVLTAEDIPGANEGRYPDYPVLAEKEVRFIGDAVALIAAETRDAAEEAARALRVEWEPLPGIHDFESPEAPPVCDWEMSRGDAEAGFDQADAVVENTYRTGFAEHGFLEPEAGCAWVDERGVVNVRVVTQTIENYQNIARILGLPASRVRLTCPMVGGAFGGKEHPLLGAFMALLAMKTGRPVRIAYSREETLVSGSKRHPFLIRMRTGATREGRLVAFEVDIRADAGAYKSNSAGLVLSAMCVSTGPYEVPNARGRARALLTNNPFTEAMRGVGNPQVTFACEAQMDELAARLGLDPVEFRRRNFLRKGGHLISGQEIKTTAALEETLAKVVEALGPPGRVPEKDRGPWRAGRGIAANLTGYCRANISGEAFVSLEADGSVSVRAGATDVGGGQAQAYRQVAAEALGVPIEKVAITMSDSGVTPLCGITAGSRQTLISGGAVRRAALAIRENLLKAAADLLEARPEDLAVVDGQICVAAAPDRKVALPAAIARCKALKLPLYHTGEVRLGDHTYPGHERYKGLGGWIDYTFGVHGAEAEVNLETGELRVLRYAASHDVGQAINPIQVEGQFEGGAMMGVGQAVCEELFTERGALRTPSFVEYLIPTAVETPEWRSLIVESGDGLGPYGAKGIGEPPTCAAIGAVANAASYAIGRRVTRVPITPEHVLTLLGKMG